MVQKRIAATLIFVAATLIFVLLNPIEKIAIMKMCCSDDIYSQEVSKIRMA